MKGVNKSVVEIWEPQDENIERVLVFFKPNSEANNVEHRCEAAQKYASQLVSRRHAPVSAWPPVLWACLTLAAVGVVCLLLTL